VTASAAAAPEFGLEVLAEDLQLGPSPLRPQVRRGSHRRPIDGVQFGRPVFVHQQHGERGDEFIAGGAGDGPLLGERFVGPEDLLDHEIGALTHRAAQALEIAPGVREPVDMIDTKSVNHPPRHQVQC
jgi:hypothetical protein